MHLFWFIDMLAGHTLIILLYVDDIILTDDSPQLLQHLVHDLGMALSMEDLSPFNYFLVIEVT